MIDAAFVRQRPKVDLFNTHELRAVAPGFPHEADEIRDMQYLIALNNRKINCRPFGPHRVSLSSYPALTDGATDYRPSGPFWKFGINLAYHEAPNGSSLGFLDEWVPKENAHSAI